MNIPGLPHRLSLTVPADIKKKIDPVAPPLPTGTINKSGQEPPVPVMVREEVAPVNGSLPQGPLSIEDTAEEEGPESGCRQLWRTHCRRIPADIKKQWPAFLELLMRDRPNIGTFLSLASVVCSSESSIDLCYPQKMKFQFGEMTKKQNREEIIKMLAAFADRPIEVHITLSTEKTEDHGRNYIQQTQCAPILDNEIEREPIIQAGARSL
jgi:hypothetical protein